MIRPILAVFAIVAIAAMMGASSVAPAYAAELLVNENTKTTVSFPFFIPICDTFPVNLTITTTITDKQWDNNKTNLHTLTKTVATDPEGNTVGQGLSTRSEIGEFDVFPLKHIVQDNNKFSCTNGASDPNFEVDTKEGSTTFQNELGEITHESNHGPSE